MNTLIIDQTINYPVYLSISAISTVMKYVQR